MDGTNLINGCAQCLALSFRKARSSPAAPLARSALSRLLPGRLGICTSHIFVPLSFGKAISKLACLLLISAMLKLCGGAAYTRRVAHLHQQGPVARGAQRVSAQQAVVGDIWG